MRPDAAGKPAVSGLEQRGCELNAAHAFAIVVKHLPDPRQVGAQCDPEKVDVVVPEPMAEGIEDADPDASPRLDVKRIPQKILRFHPFAVECHGQRAEPCRPGDGRSDIVGRLQRKTMVTPR